MTTAPQGVWSFNRDIVECKGNLNKSNCNAYNSFNRDIVECKVMLIEYGDLRHRRFNRDIVECKVLYASVS